MTTRPITEHCEQALQKIAVKVSDSNFLCLYYCFSTIANVLWKSRKSRKGSRD